MVRFLMATSTLPSFPCQTLLAENGSYGGSATQYFPGKRKGTKKKAYLVISRNCLYIYSNYLSKKEDDCFLLHKYSVRVCDDIKGELWGFKLVSSDDVYYFAVPSEREQEEWIKKLKEETVCNDEDAEDYDYTFDSNICRPVAHTPELATYEHPIVKDGDFTSNQKRIESRRNVPHCVENRYQSSALPSPIPLKSVLSGTENPIKSPPTDKNKCKIASGKPDPPPRPKVSKDVPIHVKTPIITGLHKENKETINFLKGVNQMHYVQHVIGKKTTANDNDSDDSSSSDYLPCIDGADENNEKENKFNPFKHREEPDGWEYHEVLPESALQVHLDREEAVRRLMGCQDGTYIIRKGSKVPRVLTVFFQDKIRHFKIFESPFGERLDSNPVFNSTRDLVHYYYSNNLPNDGKRLVMPFTDSKF